MIDLYALWVCASGKSSQSLRFSNVRLFQFYLLYMRKRKKNDSLSMRRLNWVLLFEHTLKVPFHAMPIDAIVITDFIYQLGGEGIGENRGNGSCSLKRESVCFLYFLGRGSGERDAFLSIWLSIMFLCPQFRRSWGGHIGLILSVSPFLWTPYLKNRLRYEADIWCRVSLPKEDMLINFKGECIKYCQSYSPFVKIKCQLYLENRLS